MKDAFKLMTGFEKFGPKSKYFFKINHNTLVNIQINNVFIFLIYQFVISSLNKLLIRQIFCVLVTYKSFNINNYIQLNYIYTTIFFF